MTTKRRRRSDKPGYPDSTSLPSKTPSQMTEIRTDHAELIGYVNRDRRKIDNFFRVDVHLAPK